MKAPTNLYILDAYRLFERCNRLDAALNYWEFKRKINYKGMFSESIFNRGKSD